MSLITLISRTKKINTLFNSKYKETIMSFFFKLNGYLFAYSARKCNPIHYPAKLVKMMRDKYIEEQYICFISCPMKNLLPEVIAVSILHIDLVATTYTYQCNVCPWNGCLQVADCTAYIYTHRCISAGCCRWECEWEWVMALWGRQTASSISNVSSRCTSTRRVLAS